MLHITNMDILKAACDRQLCAGHISGCEAGVHAMTDIQVDEQTEAVLLVDTSNAFNSLNREAAMRNIQSLCPPLAKIVVITYRNNAPLLIDGEVIPSQEGTTQGDPLAICITAIATIPLIRKRPKCVNHIWYTDDASAGGKRDNLRSWWNKIQELGPVFGYFPNVQKAGCLLRNNSCQMLRANHLAKIAHSQPQSAYCALINGLMSRWIYLMCVVPDPSNKLQPIEEALRFRFLPAITGRSNISDVERRVFALPARDGGLGIRFQLTSTYTPYGVGLRERGVYLAHHPTHQSTRVLLAQAGILRCFMHSLWMGPTGASKPMLMWCSTQHHTCLQLPQRSISNNQVQSHPRLDSPASHWGVPKCWVWTTPSTPIRRNFPAPNHKLGDNARPDVKALGFWGNEKQCAFFDVRMFNPFVPSHASQTIQSTYRKNEKEKRRQYEKRITDIEHGSFTPLVMSATGGLGPSAGVFYKRLACMISQKHISPYCETMKMIWCKLAFSLVDSAGLCLRGARSALHRPARLDLNDTPLTWSSVRAAFELISFFNDKCTY